MANSKSDNGTNNVNASNEPTEIDPCLEDTKNQEKLNVFQQYRDKISKKSGLSHKGVYIVGTIIVFAVIMIIVVIALGSAWPRIPHEYQHPICRKPECLRASEQIRESLVSTVSPCDDLWTAMCGGWLEKYSLPKDRSLWNPKQLIAKKEAERVRDLLGTLKLPLHFHTVEWKLKNFYDACMNVDNINREKELTLTKLISELGGWYILEDWSEMVFDKDELLTKLQVKYGVSPYFKILVEPNPNMPGQHAIRISPSGLGLPDREYYYRGESDRIQVAYKEFIRDVLIYLGAPRAEATKFATDIFSYEKRIAEITPPGNSLQNPITTFNAISLSELKQTNLIPLFEILQAMYQNSQITENTEVIVTSLEYLEQIAQIVATTDRKTMNGYLIWTLVNKYVPYLSDEFASAFNTFNSELYGIEVPLERWEFCANIVTEYMGFATDYLLSTKFPVKKETVKIVNETFVSLNNVIYNKLSEMEDTTFLSKYLQTKIASLQLLTGILKKVTDEDFVKEFYNSLSILKSSFFDSIKNTILFQKKLEEQQLSKKPYEEILLSYPWKVPSIKYLQSEHTVFIPRSLLMEPVLDHNYASSIIYGRLGVELAEAIVSSITPYGSLWTSDQKILTPYHLTVTESFKSVEESMKCLRKYILNLNLDVPVEIANETALNMAKHISAVTLTKEAMSTKANSEIHVHQPTLESYEDDALFFISYAQTQCSESTSQYQLFENMVHFELSQRKRLHLVWAQVPGFAESLQCDYNKKIICRNIFP